MRDVPQANAHISRGSFLGFFCSYPVESWKLEIAFRCESCVVGRQLEEVFMRILTNNYARRKTGGCNLSIFVDSSSFVDDMKRERNECWGSLKDNYAICKMYNKKRIHISRKTHNELLKGWMKDFHIKSREKMILWKRSNQRYEAEAFTKKCAPFSKLIINYIHRTNEDSSNVSGD